MPLKQAFSTTDGVTDLLYVSTHVALPFEPPVDFEFEYEVSPPIEVLSPTAKFSSDLLYEFASFFRAFYDPILKRWKDEFPGNPGNLPLEMKADVLIQEIAYALYLQDKKVYDFAASNNRWAAYRAYMAQVLIDRCAP